MIRNVIILAVGVGIISKIPIRTFIEYTKRRYVVWNIGREIDIAFNEKKEVSIHYERLRDDYDTDEDDYVSTIDPDYLRFEVWYYCGGNISDDPSFNTITSTIDIDGEYHAVSITGGNSYALSSVELWSIVSKYPICPFHSKYVTYVNCKKREQGR